ncbi:OmpA family protein [Flavobacterium sp. 123]|jgi:outer membrane protein OmpA-like peptidoglycan-associated protein|uniref:OmpA family protein n=1 Tax=Flavobacterium sp. 123 TaxID=2135627 RepID=UPI000EB41BBA|nr:OmpA family protein [Flavobacterium sp. 123]RKS99678.1 WD40 repeat protein [Flavobacterium sp. 123]
MDTKKILFLFILCPLLVFSQQNAIKEADKKVKNFEYLAAIKIYERLYKNGQATPEVMENLANIYYKNAAYVLANKWFAKLYTITPQMKSESHYRYAQTLKTVGLSEQSKEQLELFKKQSPNQIRTLLLNAPSDRKPLFEFSNIKPLLFNSELSDFGTTLKGDTLLFSSARGNALSNTIYPRTGQYFIKIYETVKKDNNDFSEPKLFSKASYSDYHETTPVFSKDGKTMYYTQNRLLGSSVNESQSNEFELFKSVFENGKWITKGGLSFAQKDSVRIAHPAISPDGKSLFFASDMAGTFGDSDLFKIEINEDGSFGKISHLPNTINTEGRETYPFVTKNNTLIFASDGHPGNGGLDLFSIDLTDVNAKVIHLGNDINSSYDDFGLIIDNQNSRGYYTSNKPGGMGDDDIYSFDVIEKPNLDKLKGLPLVLDVVIRDEKTNKTLDNVSVSITNSDNSIIANAKTDLEGKINFNTIMPNSVYTVKLEKDKYILKEVELRMDAENKISTILLSKMLGDFDISKVPTVVDYDVAADLQIDKIYFDLNKHTIRDDAKLKLNNLVAYMNLHPRVNIEIGSHTDSRASKEYNLILSQKRAQSILNYLTAKGIVASRLIAVGYGELKLTNNCSDGVKCSENEHEKNRRSTFLIIK